MRRMLWLSTSSGPLSSLRRPHQKSSMWCRLDRKDPSDPLAHRDLKDPSDPLAPPEVELTRRLFWDTRLT